MRQGNREAVRRVLERVIEANPNNTLAQLWLASMGENAEEQPAALPPDLRPQTPPEASATQQPTGPRAERPKGGFTLLDQGTLQRERPAQPAMRTPKPKIVRHPAMSAPLAAEPSAVVDGLAADFENLVATPPAAAPAGPMPRAAPSDAPLPVEAAAASPDSAPVEVGANSTPSDAAASSALPVTAVVAQPSSDAAREDVVAAQPVAAPDPAPGVQPADAVVLAPPAGTTSPDAAAGPSAQVQAEASSAGAPASVPPSTTTVEEQDDADVSPGDHLATWEATPQTNNVAAPGRQQTEPSTPDRAWRLWPVLVVMAVGAVCALAVAAAVINDLRQPAAQAPASIAAGNLQAKSAPGAATTVRTVWGTFAVPGTGFADASRVTAADRRVSVVPVWPEAWATNDSPTCALLHGGEVQLLEVADDRPGGRWFKVRRGECTGWVEDRFLSVASPSMPARSTATAPK